MPLNVGDKLGHFEVLSLLGAGGMGEVYRARDTTLKRDVALKILPATFLRDPERMARFQGEAEVLASLDHPNIGHIHGIVESEDSRGLVLALIEGPTLADRIDAGPVPLEEVIVISKQIVEALEYAHERGVVHRDLKPANIKITPDGVVKVLDFGLAKVLEDEPPTLLLTNSPTLTMGHTRAGVILGTAAYMSPEQAIGRPVDRRSDIFSFGAVLYEMLSGKRAFTGTTAPDVLEAVVKSDPDWSALPTGTPAYLRRLLERTLAKDRKERLQAVGEARITLRGPMEETATAAMTAPLRSRLSNVVLIAAAVLAVVSGVALWALWRATQPVDHPLVRLYVDLGADVLLPATTSTTSGLGSSVAISPDGMRLAYASGTPPKLFTRRLDQPRATELPGTQGAAAPFFSADGRWIGFEGIGGNANKISVDGGAVVPLGEVSNFTGASWGEDGSIFMGVQGKGVVRIREGGGQPETIVAPGNGEIALVFPQILPGGKAVLFSAYTAPNPDAASIEVITLPDRHRKKVSRGGTSPRYIATSNGAGYLVYLNKATLFAIPFDLEKLETSGTAVPILDDVASQGTLGTAQLSSSRSGTLVYRSGGATGANLVTAQWLDALGKTQPMLAKPGVYLRPRLSPDGQRLALDDGSDILVYEPRRDTVTRLTFGGGTNIVPVWSPDGRYIVFRGNGGMWWVRSDGAGKPQLLIQGKEALFPAGFTPDGKRLAYNDVSPRTDYDIWTVPIESDGAALRAGIPEVFLQTRADERHGTFSPDGRWLAYTSNESGMYQVYVRAFPDKGGKWQISNAGGAYPLWSSNGHELFFRTDDNRIMAATYVAKGDSFVPDKPRLWSDKRLANLGAVRRLANLGTLDVGNYDLTPDGKRIVALMPVEGEEAQQTQSHVNFLENFSDDLRRKVLMGK
jgi:serine/threonine-protein kinase